jgi:hypothetical protein
VYRLAQGLSYKAMNNLYRCEKTTTRKYTLIVYGVISLHEGLFGRYIHAPIGHRLTDIIRKFHDITGLSNVVGVIDGTHTPLSCKPHKGLTPMFCNFFNTKKFQCIITSCVRFGKIFLEYLCRTT